MSAALTGGPEIEALVPEPPYLLRIYSRGIRVLAMHWRTAVRFCFVPLVTILGINLAKGFSGAPITLLGALFPFFKPQPSNYDLGMIEQ